MADQVFRADSPVVNVHWISERLLPILNTAVSLQPETESVLRRCEVGSSNESPLKNAILARRASRLTSALLHLVDRANALPGCLVVDEARGLLCYHHRLLTESLGYAFGPNHVLGRSDTERPPGAARPLPDYTDSPNGAASPEGTHSPDSTNSPDEADHLGEPAARLRRLRNLVATDLNDSDLSDGDLSDSELSDSAFSDSRHDPTFPVQLSHTRR